MALLADHQPEYINVSASEFVEDNVSHFADGQGLCCR